MATKAELRTRLKRRLGFAVVSSVEDERLGEALNSGIARAISDKVPGLSHDIFQGSVSGELALTTAVISAGGTTVTLDSQNPITYRVYPHDIIVVDVSGTETKFLIRDTKDANEVDIGTPSPAAYSGGSASKVIRRSIPLPTTGQIVEVFRVGSTGRTSKLVYEPLYAHSDPFETGTPKFFEQRYSETHGKSFISLWPAPTSSTDQFTIIQTRAVERLDSDSDTLLFPEEALDAILERARLAYLSWAGTSLPVKASLAMEAVKDSSDSLKNTSNATQIFTKQ
jgi:hypothetical protein